MVLDQIANALVPYLGFIIGGILAAVAAFGAQIISDKAEDKRLRIQLFNDETKRAIERLYQLVNTPMDRRNPEQWRWGIFQYLKSFEAQAYLPQEERSWARRELDENYWNRLVETWPDSYMTEEEAEFEEQIEQDEVDRMGPVELEEYHFEQYWKKLQAEANTRLINAVYGLAKPKKSKFSERAKPSFRSLRRLKFWTWKRRAPIVP